MKRAIPVVAQRESAVQRDVKKFYERVGCKVYVFSQGRKTRQTPGIPDLYVFPATGVAFWHEVKAADGKQSDEQKTFQMWCGTAGTPYVIGGTVAAYEWWNTRQERAA